jgi:hypothetical protein
VPPIGVLLEIDGDATKLMVFPSVIRLFYWWDFEQVQTSWPSRLRHYLQIEIQIQNDNQLIIQSCVYSDEKKRGPPSAQ